MMKTRLLLGTSPILAVALLMFATSASAIADGETPASLADLSGLAVDPTPPTPRCPSLNRCTPR